MATLSSSLLHFMILDFGIVKNDKSNREKKEMHGTRKNLSITKLKEKNDLIKYLECFYLKNLIKTNIDHRWKTNSPLGKNTSSTECVMTDFTIAHIIFGR